MGKIQRMTEKGAMAWLKEHYKESLAYLSATDTSEFDAYYAESGLSYEQARDSYIASRKLVEE